MKLAAFGDLHLGIQFDGLDLTSDTLGAVDEMIVRARAEAVERFVCLGDVFHHPKPNASEGGVDAFLHAFQILHDLLAVAPVDIIPGNHDLHERNDLHDGLAVIEAAHLAGVHVVRDVERLDYGLAVPYLPRYTGKAETLGPTLTQAVEKDGHRLFFGHLNLGGMILGEEDVYERGHGGSYKPSWPVDDLQGHGVTIIGGHYHGRSTVTRGDVTIHFPGSMSRMNCGEIGDKKSFLIIDTEEK
jgi:DNA repair exonuclease SbcCD nuclease subunit